MNLNENSITARLYKWFYYTTKLPQSLCPYFWKLLFMILAIVPYTIISLPFLIFTIIFPKYKRKLDKYGEYAYHKTSSDLIGNGLIGYALICYAIMLCLPLFLFADNPTLYTETIKVGFVTWGSAIIGAIIVGMIYLIDYLNQRKYRYVSLSDRNNKYNQSSIITEFVKAKYNKYCPKINWYKK